jgi:DNA-binding LytR/AlgR family response regulator
MNKLRTLVVEDEPLAREGLLAYIRDIEFLELVGVCENALEANKQLHALRPDLMFLDIHMPKLSGIDFLKSLSQPPMVIMTTAYPNFALQGYELNVMDYLVKPYPFDRFLKAVNKALDYHMLKQSPRHSPETIEEPGAQYVFVKADNKWEKILFEDVHYVEGMENYVAFHTASGRVITLLTMKRVEELLPPKEFIRIHKSYLVALSKIRSVEGNEVLVGTRKLPISRQKRAEVMEALLR